MAITRITSVWSGFRGAPGYSNFFFGGAPSAPEDAESCAQAVRNFWYGCMPVLPSSVTITTQGTADILDEETGNITEQIDFDPPSTVDGQGSAAYSAASGAVVNWNTGAYRNGRRVRGRTFIVPCSSDAYDSNGDLTTSALTAIREGAGYLTSGSSTMPFVVWARPTSSSSGSAEPVSSSTVPDMGAVLRSRRD